MESVIETYLGGVQNGVVAAVTAVTSGAVTSAVVNGASVAVGSVTSPVEPDDIPKSTKSPVWILGRQYCAAQGEYMAAERWSIPLRVSAKFLSPRRLYNMCNHSATA